VTVTVFVPPAGTGPTQAMTNDPTDCPMPARLLYGMTVPQVTGGITIPIAAMPAANLL
jgi:hypothetical protein